MQDLRPIISNRESILHISCTILNSGVLNTDIGLTPDGKGWEIVRYSKLGLTDSYYKVVRDRRFKYGLALEKFNP